MVDARERLINLETAKALGFAAVAESVLRLTTRIRTGWNFCWAGRRHTSDDGAGTLGESSAAVEPLQVVIKVVG
jgi:hypothetical protein